MYTKKQKTNFRLKKKYKNKNKYTKKSKSKKLYGGMFFKGSDLESEIKNDLDLLGFNFIIIESSDFSVMVNDEGHRVHPIVENKSLNKIKFTMDYYGKGLKVTMTGKIKHDGSDPEYSFDIKPVKRTPLSEIQKTEIKEDIINIIEKHNNGVLYDKINRFLRS